MGDEQKYFDFMKSTDYWGFILLFLFFAIIGITIFILDYKKRKRYSNGIADAPGKNRTYITPASKELIDITLAESNDEDIFVYSFEKQDDIPYIVCHKIAKKIQLSKPAAFFINYLPSVDDKTVFESVPYKHTDNSRYMPYLDEFLAKKINAIRVDPDKIFNKE